MGTLYEIYEDCGTYKAYQRHRKQGTEVDEACRVAKNDYASELRNKNPNLRRRQLAYSTARSRALERLAKAHRKEFAQLLKQERAQIKAAD